jgi:hypothetical protein
MWQRKCFGMRIPVTNRALIILAAYKCSNNIFIRETKRREV